MALTITTQFELDTEVQKLQAMVADEGLTGEASLHASEIIAAGFRVELHRGSKVWVAPHRPLPRGDGYQRERPTGFEMPDEDEAAIE